MKLAALWSALMLFSTALPAASLDEAARELARRLGSARPATVTVRNLAGLPPADIASARRILLAELGGAPAPGQTPASIHVTVSANLTDTLLVAEVQRGSERHVEIVSRPRSDLAHPTPGFPVTLTRQLLHSQAGPMLDLLDLAGGRRLVLEPASLVLIEGGERKPLPIPLPHSPARDLQGRLTRDGSTLHLTLPGIACTADLDTELKLQCAPAEFPRPTAGAESLSLEGVPGCGAYTLTADAAGEQLRAVSTRTRAPRQMSAPLEVAGTLTALWPAPGGATAVIYEEKNERYAAYSLAITCSR